MPNVFGVANHSPCQIRSALAKSGLIERPTACSILVPGASLATEPKHKVVLVLCLHDLMRNLRFINSDQYAHYRFIVFGSPVKLGDLHGVQALDYMPEPDARTHGYVLLPLKRSALAALTRNSAHQVLVNRVPEPFVSRLIGTVVKGSLLGPLMTYIYTLPNATHQVPVKQTIAQWLYSGSDLLDLNRRFDQIKHIQITPKIKTRFAEILNSEVARSFKAVFQDYRRLKRDSTTSLEQICRQHNVDPYEVRYLLSVLTKDAAPVQSTTSDLRNLRQVKSRMSNRAPAHSTS